MSEDRAEGAEAEAPESDRGPDQNPLVRGLLRLLIALPFLVLLGFGSVALLTGKAEAAGCMLSLAAAPWSVLTFLLLRIAAGGQDLVEVVRPEVWLGYLVVAALFNAALLWHFTGWLCQPSASRRALSVRPRAR